ncbi:PQQ-dependent sugar dehydrogenase [Rufibacter sediminis]|uniref:PQQ-dependent sugar dehydrogenase n=1 Tax=Rufibacter sediminis TaxID=2762756 RepID=A0ABR6VZ44_9BACT|nr:PQQ-dependent sugar dehydrogenase [Rufibacter sediminis]MBC3542431.1 PQQ-dependent sugar dehydrogenase [Rufibacter sediminis]
MKILLRFYIVALLLLLCSGCYKIKGSYGGPKNFNPQMRPLQPLDVALPAGYTIEPIASGLTYPTGITFDEQGTVYVTESGYAYGEVWLPPKLLRLNPDGTTTQIAAGDKNGPWTGTAYHDGFFYVSEGGQLEGGRILKISRTGQITRLVEGLPSYGDHHTDAPVIGKDGYLYFGQGTATNSGVVGTDNYHYGWLKRNPTFHDIPCQDIVLTGQNFTTYNPLTEDDKDEVTTGAYLPFGTPSTPNQTIKGAIPCSGAIFRVPLQGGPLELVAWGLRNPYGLSFSPNGQLYVTDNGYDTRGSRPGYGTGDVLWAVQSGKWYGWPDFASGQPMASDDYKTPHDDPKFLLAQHPGTPPKPAAILGVHSSSNGLDFSRTATFGHVGEAFIAQFGDMTPEVGHTYGPVGFKVVRVNPATGVIEDFAVNKSKTNGPASIMKNGGLERPIAVKFNPEGTALYVVDFGIMPMTEQGPAPKQQTGVVWKITKTAAR